MLPVDILHAVDLFSMFFSKSGDDVGILDEFPATEEGCIRIFSSEAG